MVRKRDPLDWEKDWLNVENNLNMINAFNLSENVSQTFVPIENCRHLTMTLSTDEIVLAIEINYKEVALASYNDNSTK